MTGVTRIGARAGMIAAGGAAALAIAIVYGISGSGSHHASTASAPAPQAIATDAATLDAIPGAVPSSLPLPAAATPRPTAAPVVLPAAAPAPPSNAPAAAPVPAAPLPAAPVPAARLPVAPVAAAPVPTAPPAPNPAQLAAQQRADLERQARAAAIVVALPSAATAAGTAAPQPPAPKTTAPAASPYALLAGSVIPATLVSGIDSDLAGTIVAQVNQNVLDTKTGRHVLIPAGSKLIGKVDGGVPPGGNRVQVAWTRIIFPNATSVDISGATGSDGAGYAGLSGNVDDHQNHSVLRTALTSILGIGAALLQPRMVVAVGGVPTVVMAQTPAQTALAQAGTQATQAAAQQMNAQSGRPPTISVPPGTVFNVIVGNDLTFAAPVNG